MASSKAELLERAEREIYNTYHHPKNKEILPIVLFFGVVFIIFKNPLFYEILLWGWYYSYCSKNNQKLNNDPYILKRRQYWIELRQDVLSGKFNCK